MLVHQKMLRVLLILVATTSLPAERSEAQSSTPPSSEIGPPLSADVVQWKDLINYRPTLGLQNELALRWAQPQPIEDGLGDLNLDYYPVYIVTLPTIDDRQLTPEELLSTVRSNFQVFLDPSVATFEPYQDRDGKMWNSQNPARSLMRFKIIVPTTLAPNAPPVYTNVDDGSVVTSDVTQDHWNFTPYFTPKDLYHPVSGTRQFGIKKNGKLITFYIRGADRVSSVPNYIASGTVFSSADQLWSSFQDRLAKYVNDHGGVALLGTGNNRRVSQRVAWKPELVGFGPEQPWLFEVLTQQQLQSLKRTNGFSVLKDGTWSGSTDAFGRRNGPGELASIGATYRGSFVNGNPDGSFQLDTTDGTSISGTWSNGKLRDGYFRGKLDCMFYYDGHIIIDPENANNVVPHGIGSLMASGVGSYPGTRYVGTFSLGTFLSGTFFGFLQDLGLFDGDWNGGINGKGKLYRADGWTLEGIFAEGQMEGPGSMETSDASADAEFPNWYGEFKDGQPLGEGASRGRDGWYATEFNNGVIKKVRKVTGSDSVMKYTPSSTISFPDAHVTGIRWKGGKYVLNYVVDKSDNLVRDKDGNCAVRGKLADGADYDGMADNLFLPNGEGTLKKNGESWAGNWGHGNFKSGTIIFADGTKYVGSFDQGSAEGQAQLFTPDGYRLVGIFSHGKMIGTVAVTDPSGRSFSGQVDSGGHVSWSVPSRGEHGGRDAGSGDSGSGRGGGHDDMTGHISWTDDRGISHDKDIRGMDITAGRGP